MAGEHDDEAIDPTDAKIARAVELLRQHGFKIKISACGCCSSPWVKLSYNGEPIIWSDDDEDSSVDFCSIDMFGEGA